MVKEERKQLKFIKLIRSIQETKNDNSHAIEIEAKGFLIHISNDVQPTLLKILADALKELSC